MATNAQPIGVIAKLLDLTERRVQQLSREGVVPKAERGQYDLVGAVRGYVAYLRDLAVRAQAGAPDFGAERARLIKAKADLAEMDASGRRGELLPATSIPQWRTPKTALEQEAMTDAAKKAEGAREMRDYDLLVPNIELATGCAPQFLPGVPPSLCAEMASVSASRLARSSLPAACTAST